jgi:hypothetical protein
VLCRVLGQLPQLRDCNFMYADAQFSSPLRPPTCRCLLPLLPAIRSFWFIGPRSQDVLGLLVMWTRLPCSNTAALPCCDGGDLSGAIRFDVQCNSSANRGWLHTLLHNQLPINFVISQDSNMRSLLPDLKQHSRPLALTLQSKVEPGMLGELLAAYSGEQLTLSINPPSGTAHTPEGQAEDGSGHLPT